MSRNRCKIEVETDVADDDTLAFFRFGVADKRAGSRQFASVVPKNVATMRTLSRMYALASKSALARSSSEFVASLRCVRERFDRRLVVSLARTDRCASSWSFARAWRRARARVMRR